MVPLLLHILLIFIFSILAGFVGSLLGLGGGIIVIPTLTLALGLDIHEAIGASIISVIATSSGAAMAYVRDKLTNIRLGMFLETATTIGAITGAYIAEFISIKALYITFALLMLYSAWNMFRSSTNSKVAKVQAHPLADRLKLNSSYLEQKTGEMVKYKVAGIYPGWATMYIAGILSGLLGIGGGVFKVLGMDMFMKLPIKVSTATSNFMIGVTAAASAGVYFSKGDINPLTAGPVALGVLLGALVGTKIMVRLNNQTLRRLFIPVLLYVALQMLWKGWWM